MIQLNDEQTQGFEQLERFRARTRNLEEANLIFVLSGYAGTGKTTLISHFVDQYPKGVMVTAPTHKAKNVLMRKIDTPDIQFNTVHSALGLKEDIQPDGSVEFTKAYTEEDKLDGVRLLIVDEASMVNKSLIGYLMDASYAYHLPIIFVGDNAQLPPVNEKYSPVFDKDWQEQVKAETFALTTIVRQAEGNPIIESSMKVREMPVEIGYPELQNMLCPNVTELGAIEHVNNSLLHHLDPLFKSDDGDFAKVVCYTNRRVAKHNERIRRFLNPTAARIIDPGDRIILTEPLVEGNISLLDNNTEAWVMDVKNSTVELNGLEIPCYVCEINPDNVKQTFRIKVPNKEGAKIHKELLAGMATRAKEAPKGSLTAKGYWQDFYKVKRIFVEWQHGYALTTHRAQGSTFTNAIIDMGDLWLDKDTFERNRLIYTAITRASTNIYLIF